MPTTQHLNRSAISHLPSDCEATPGLRVHALEKRALVWTAFVGLALLLAVMVQALAMHLSEMPQQPEPSDICLTPNPATVALADGDDVRARFLASLCSAPTEVAPPQ